MRATLLPFLLAAGPAATLCAQPQLVPLWQHEWPFGQGEGALYNPPGADNHVSVDPVTGLVHCTVDDSWENASPRGEYLFTFNAEGIDLTGPAPPIIAPAPPDLGSAFSNANGTSSFTVFDGRAYGTHSFRAAGVDWGSFASGGVIGGAPWTTSLFQPQSLPGGLRRTVVDAAGVVFEGNDQLLGIGHNGLPRWRVASTVENGVQGLCAHNGLLYVVRSGAIERWSVADGIELPPLPGPGNAFVTVWIAVADGHLFTLHPTGPATHRVMKRTLEGALVWQYDAAVPAGHDAAGLVVDATGRAWCGFSPWYDEFATDAPGLVVVVTSDGAASELFAHGSYLNGMATDGQRIYLTGAADPQANDTYLAAIDAQMPTGIAGMPAPAFVLHPNPATHRVRIEGPVETITAIDVLDAHGRWLMRASPGMGFSIDVSGLAAGGYLLRLHHRAGSRVLRFAVAR